MSRIYTPSAIESADAEIAAAPFYGGEWAVYLSHTPAKRLADIDMTNSGSGVLRINSAQSIISGGAPLQIVSTSRLRSAVPTVITLNVVNDLNASVTAAATFAPPARVQDQSYNFQRGYAQDFTLSAGTGIKTLSSLASIQGGRANCSFSIYELPDSADYYLVGCTTDKNFTMKDRVGAAISCGMETDAFPKQGVTKEAMLTVSQKLKSFADGLARVAGGRVTAKLVGIKDGQVTDTVIVFTDWRPTNSGELPDRDGEAMLKGDGGKYGEALMFVAPG